MTSLFLKSKCSFWFVNVLFHSLPKATHPPITTSSGRVKAKGIFFLLTQVTYLDGNGEHHIQFHQVADAHAGLRGSECWRRGKMVLYPATQKERSSLLAPPGSDGCAIQASSAADFPGAFCPFQLIQTPLKRQMHQESVSRRSISTT